MWCKCWSWGGVSAWGALHCTPPLPPSPHSPGGQDGGVMFLMFGSLHPSTSTHLHPSLPHSSHHFTSRQSPGGQDGCVMFLIFGSLHPSTSTHLHRAPLPPSLHSPVTKRTRWLCYVFNVRLTPPLHIHPPAPLPPSLHSPVTKRTRWPGTNLRCGGCGAAPTASLSHPIAPFLKYRTMLHPKLISAPYCTYPHYTAPKYFKNSSSEAI